MMTVSGVLPHVRAAEIRCALQDRVLGAGDAGGGRLWRAVLLMSGSGTLLLDEVPHALRAPCLAWIPWGSGHELRIMAGGVGHQFTIGEQVLADAIGHNPESAELRHLTDRWIFAPLQEAGETLDDAENAFDLIVRETRRPRAGSWTMIQAQVRAVLVMLWRSTGAEDPMPVGRGEAARILLHFRQHLEVHFRDRWPVRRYAEALGVSPDRLHDTCQRKLGKTPLQLVHERVIHEARLRLERSTQTVDQLAASLGFRDVGHFSRFFKSKVGQPPGAYRDHLALSASSGSAAVQPSSYADWP